MPKAIMSPLLEKMLKDPKAKEDLNKALLNPNGGKVTLDGKTYIIEKGK